MDMCAVRLQDAWARFCAEVVVLSALKKPITRNGQRLPRSSSVKSEEDVKRVVWAMSFPKRPMPPTWEPGWHRPQIVLDLALKLQLVNYAQIQAGVSLMRSPLEDLRQVRNFLVHRGRNTGLTVRTLSAKQGLALSGRARDIMAQRVVPGVSVFERWVSDLRSMADVATQ